MQTPPPLPTAMSDYSKIWYLNKGEIPVTRVSYLDGTVEPVNALTSTPDVKRMQEMANVQRSTYIQAYPSTMELFEDATDVFMNMIPDVLASRESFGTSLSKGNRMRGVAVILITLGLVAIAVEILLSDA
jgi:hypothetical protein